MKRYCLDTSGITSSLHTMPEDIHPTLWKRVAEIIRAGEIAVTTELYEKEMEGMIWSPIGSVIDSHRSDLILEVGHEDWDYASYISESSRLLQKYRQYISEYIPGKPDNTVCVNDMSIIALAKATRLPLISMETSAHNSPKYKRIPDVCSLEGIEHLDFNKFLRREGIKV